MADVVVSGFVNSIADKLNYYNVETNLPPRFFWLNPYVLWLYILFYTVKYFFTGKGLIVGSFSNSSIVACIVAGFIMKKKSIFFMNHNHTSKNKMVIFCIRLLSRVGCNLVAFDLIDGADENLNFLFRAKNFYSIPHPVPEMNFLRESKDNISVGIVGRIRPEKRIDENIFFTNKFANFIKLTHGVDVVKIIGAPLIDFDNISCDVSDWILLDTESYDNYKNCISKIDILVIIYDYESYRLRPSGVISEVISMGKFVVASGGFSIKEQLRNPVDVGFYVDSLSGDNLFNDIYDKYLRIHSGDIEEYCRARSLNSVAKNLISRI